MQLAGSNPPHHGAGPFPGQPLPYPESFGGSSVAPYPAALPPPIAYPKRRRGRTLAWILIALAIVAAIVTAVVFAGRGDAPDQSAVITAPSAQRAIQGYLDALSDGDIQAISRNMLCGLYDGVRDRRTDDALAQLSSDTFRKQFSGAEVISVDELVFTSPGSAQALFTMKAQPAASSRAGGGAERQAVAQLLTHKGDILVCSYVQRSAGSF